MDEKGEISSTVIFVATVILAVMVVVQFGLSYHMRNVLSGAAQDGAAAAARYGGDPGEGAVVAESLIVESSSSLLESYEATSERVGDRIVVTVHGSVVSVVPGLGSIDVSATASAPIEQFLAQEG